MPGETAKKRKNPCSLIGLCCTGFCLVGLPLLSLLLSAVGIAWTGHGWVMWSLLAFSLLMFGLGMRLSFRHHGHWGPAFMAIFGAALLIAKQLNLMPWWAEWVGMGALLDAWFWDWKLHQRSHVIEELNARAGGLSESPPPEKEAMREKR